MDLKKVIAGLIVAFVVAACELSTAPDRAAIETSSPPEIADPASSTAVRWPGPHEDSPDLSFPSAAEAVEFLGEHMAGDIVLPAWVPSNIHLDTDASVFLATVDGHRTAQVHLTMDGGEAWGIQYGVSGLDGCAPEVSTRVMVSGQPGRLRVSADPSGSSRTWVQLIWPATLRRTTGVYGLFGWLRPRDVLAMAASMPPVSPTPDHLPRGSC